MHHLLHALGERPGHVLRFTLGFNGTLNHFVALLDGLVQVLENLHVVHVPVVSSLHLGHGQPEVVVQLLSDAEDLAKAIFLPRVLLFHLLEFGFKVFDSLGILGGLHLKFTNADVLFCDDGFERFFLDFTVDDFLFQHFDFGLCIHEFFLLRFVGCKQLLQTISLGGEGFLKLLDLDLRRDGSFRHVVTRRSSLRLNRVHSSLSSRRSKEHRFWSPWPSFPSTKRVGGADQFSSDADLAHGVTRIGHHHELTLR